MTRAKTVAWVLAACTLACLGAQAGFLAAGGMSLWGAAAIDRGFPLVTLAAVAGAVVGALILSKHPRHPIGWLFSIGQFGTAAGQVGEAYAWAVLDGNLRGAPELAHTAAWLSATGSLFLVTSLALLALLAPNGRLPSRRWRPVVSLVVTSAGLVVIGLMLVPPREMEPNQAPTASPLTTFLVGAGQIGLTLGLLLAGTALVLRLRHAAGEERQQLRWIAVSTTAAALTLVAVVLHNATFGDEVPTDWRLALLFSLSLLGIPVATGFAVLRYRLYDIDLVIGAAVKAGVLATFVTVGYVAVVTVTAGLLGRAGPPSFAASLVALVLVAVAFQPLRRRLDRLADRVVYGRRADPYEALAGFGRNLADRLTGAAALPWLAETLAVATGALQVQARLLLPNGAHTVTWPEGPTPTRAFDLPFPVQRHGEQLGEMLVRLPPGRSLSRPQRRLAAELVEQAGLVFRNVRLDASLEARAEALDRLTEELAASRRRLLAARDIERDHLVRAIQRDVTRHLEPMCAELDRLPEVLMDDAAAARHLLEGLECNANRALDALRDLTHGLFPNLLALRGLPTALEAYAQRVDQPPSFEGIDEVRDLRLPPTVEAAGYFCCVETLTVLTGCRVLITVRDHHLSLTCSGRVTDPLPATFEQRLTDRAEAIDGRVGIERDNRDHVVVSICLPLHLDTETLPPPERSGTPGPASALL